MTTRKIVSIIAMVDRQQKAQKHHKEETEIRKGEGRIEDSVGVTAVNQS